MVIRQTTSPVTTPSSRSQNPGRPRARADRSAPCGRHRPGRSSRPRRPTRPGATRGAAPSTARCRRRAAPCRGMLPMKYPVPGTGYSRRGLLLVVPDGHRDRHRAGLDGLVAHRAARAAKRGAGPLDQLLERLGVCRAGGDADGGLRASSRPRCARGRSRAARARMRRRPTRESVSGMITPNSVVPTRQATSSARTLPPMAAPSVLHRHLDLVGGDVVDARERERDGAVVGARPLDLARQRLDEEAAVPEAGVVVAALEQGGLGAGGRRARPRMRGHDGAHAPRAGWSRPVLPPREPVWGG